MGKRIRVQRRGRRGQFVIDVDFDQADIDKATSELDGIVEVAAVKTSEPQLTSGLPQLNIQL